MFAITEDPWNDAHFLTVSGTTPDLKLSQPDGSVATLGTELDGADVVVLLATDGSSEGAAETIAKACFERRIMCAALALGDGKDEAALDRVVNSMRQYARVLVVAQDADYIPAMLTALRA